jgi:hypothetical protein
MPDIFTKTTPPNQQKHSPCWQIAQFLFSFIKADFACDFRYTAATESPKEGE